MVIRQLQPKKTAPAPARRGRLRDLGKVVLNPRHQAMLDFAVKHCGGDAAWRGRKRVEAQEILALSQLAPPGRLTVQFIDLREVLRALLITRVPVPCHPDANNELRVADHAVLGFTYPPEAVRMPLPGPAFFQILEPQGVWLPQVDPAIQRHCVAALVPAGTPCKELILMSYGALCMQSVQVDELDPAGVFHIEAARWWQQNMHRAPLSRTSFLAADDLMDVFDLAADKELQP